MLKMVIADDERIIRETIANKIDWKKYDIEIIGLCSNGIEALDIIIDESPDIVLTDIRMPGLSGLELIKRISETSLTTQFIILSGYNEFEYAKAAMKYGVKQYLLKPCNEKEIIDSVLHCKKDCSTAIMNRKLQFSEFVMRSNMIHNIMSNIINDRICQDLPYSTIYNYYAPFIDFTFSPYKLNYIFYLEIDNLNIFLNRLKEYTNAKLPNLIISGIYVNNTLTLFFQNTYYDMSDFERFLKSVHLESSKVNLKITGQSFDNLSLLLENVLEKVKRYSMIYYINNYHAILTCNYNNIILQIQTLYLQMQNQNVDNFDRIMELLNSINNLEFLKQLSNNLLLKISNNHSMGLSFHISDLLNEIEQCNNLDDIKNIMHDKLFGLLNNKSENKAYSIMTLQICSYVKDHFQDPDLTLKYIAEKNLYMNVDYVSKKFCKETKQKFSQYLTAMRIERAKEIIFNDPKMPIQLVAEKTGCANNPKYFSRLFKKQTGITPSEYINDVLNS